MTTPTINQTNDARRTHNIKKYFIICFCVVIVIGIYYVGISNTKKRQEWKNTACPSLLSIARSSRDTLIIMKSEIVCNQYMMENLK